MIALIQTVFLSGSFYFSVVALGAPMRHASRWIARMRASPLFQAKRALAELRRLQDTLLECEEMLRSGCVLGEREEARLAALPAPWSALIPAALRALKHQGLPMLPTLASYRATFRSQAELVSLASTRAAPALAQAWVGLALVPLFSVFLYLTLPSVAHSPRLWLLATLTALIGALLGAVWIAEQGALAARGGLRSEDEPWMWMVPTAFQRFASALEAGSAPEVAWSDLWSAAFHDSTTQRAAERLGAQWGEALWGGPAGGDVPTLSGEAPAFFADVGRQLRAQIASALIEGQRCIPRVRELEAQFFLRWKDRLEKELAALAQRNLKPLFLCVAPSVFALLLTGLALELANALRDWA